MSNYLFSKDHSTSSVLLNWYDNLENNKGGRAELKRCQSVAEVVLVPAYQNIYRRLVAAGLPDELGNDRVPVLIALAAMAKENVPSDPDSFPKSLSERVSGSDRPRFSANRFRSLLKMESPDELLFGFRRALPLIDHRVDVRQLANDIYYWGETKRRQWAYAYDWPASQPE